ncbi:MAG TPA: helicase [Nannocystis exedens]|nr:helicase [Nannocystis exedens]
MVAINDLFSAVFQASARPVWARGVELARAGAVVGEHRDEDEVILRVAVTGSPIAPAVTLWVDDCEWDCECDSRREVCFHVVAAVIALKQAIEAGEELPGLGARMARVAYRLYRTPGGLAFDRAQVRGEGDEAVELTLDDRLTAYSRGRLSGSKAILTTAADMTIEVVLGGLQRGVLPLKVMRVILPHLASDRERQVDVKLDGVPIKIDATPVRPHVKVADDRESDGVRVSLIRNPAITEFFKNGAVLCGDTLRPTGIVGLTRVEVMRLKAGIIYPREQVVGLVSDVIPHLKKHTTVHIRSKRLPHKKVSLRPRVVFETRRQGDSLAVLPTIVYGEPVVARVDGQRLVTFGEVLPERNRIAEERLRTQLNFELEMSPGRAMLFLGENAMTIGERLAALGEVRGDAQHEFFRASPLRPRLRGDQGRSQITFFSGGEGTGEGTGEPREVDAHRVVDAWQRGESLVPLTGGGFAPLPVDWLERYGQHLMFLLDARGADGSIQAWARPVLAELAVDLEGHDIGPEFRALRSLVEDFEGLPPVSLPEDLGATLRDYQETGVRWLAFLRRAGLGALLADDMGLGKTLQTLCTLQPGKQTLVVMPTSVLHAWADELHRFRPALRVHRFYGPGRVLDPNADVTLTTYALLRRERERLQRAPAVEGAEPQPWDTIILDEAQSIKNPTSQVAQAAFELEAVHRVALSGTPVENRLDELWSILFFLNRGLLGSRSDFRRNFSDPIAQGSPKAAKELRRRIRPFVLRRRKSEVARELPPRTEVVLRCQLDEREREVYDALRAATRSEVVEHLAAGKGVLKALEALLRLRQASCHRGLIPGQEATSSSKVALLCETLDEIVAEGHKALVFSQWTGLLDRIEPALKVANLDFTRLDGSTRDREAVVNAFQDPAGPPVMLISLKAGGTGLTLTAADHVFLVDPWWNPAVEDQAADRAHRIGQERPVLIHRLVAENTVEERILALQARKRQIADAALGEANQAGGLSKGDLLALLD